MSYNKYVKIELLIDTARNNSEVDERIISLLENAFFGVKLRSIDIVDLPIPEKTNVTEKITNGIHEKIPSKP